MTEVSGYRKISAQGSSLCIFVTTLLKNTGMKEGDLVRVTLESVEDGSHECEGSD